VEKLHWLVGGEITPQKEKKNKKKIKYIDHLINALFFIVDFMLLLDWYFSME